MCLILFAYRHHPRYPLILAANRDEFYQRPSAPAASWPECPAVLGGRDLQQGGSWMGLASGGRLAAVTNYRDPARNREDAKSRGALVRDYLCGSEPGLSYARRIQSEALLYNGFNLLLADRGRLWHYSNMQEGIREITAGIHGLSNHLLNTPWPKVERGKKLLAEALALPEERWEDALLTLLTDRYQPPDDTLPSTGVEWEWERQLAPVFIVSPSYGTRTNTLLFISREGQARLIERTLQSETGTWSRREFLLEAADWQQAPA